MRLLQLHLLRYGPFTDRVLELNSGGLHLLYGANEAGKSTTLRAVSGLLFGIPENTRDDHLHAKPELRIAACLQNGQGQCLNIVRRKGRKNTLLDEQESALDEAVLNPYLGGVSRELFETMFGLSHEALIRGGQELLEGRGEVGRSLFGAGMGIAGLNEIKDELQKRAGEIFVPRGKIPALNQALKTFDEAKKQGRQLALKPRAWQDLQTRLQQAREQLQTLEQNYKNAHAGLLRLQRLQRVLPRLQERDALHRRLQELGPVRPLPESGSEQRRQAQHTLQHTTAQEAKLRTEKERCQQEQTTLRIPERLLERAAAIEALRDPLGAYKKAMADLPGLKASLATAEDDAHAVLRELGWDLSLEQAEQRRPDTATEARIRELGQLGAKLEIERNKARKDADGIARQLDDIRRQELPPAQDPTLLRQMLSEARRRGDLEQQLRDLEQTIGGLERRAKSRLKDLAPWQGALESISTLVLPSPETSERYHKDFDALAQTRQELDSERKRLSKELKKALTDLTKLEAQGAVPSEAELQDARDRRQQLWNQVRSAWLTTDANVDPAPLANTYEQATEQADQVADRLWQDAERAARHAVLSAERQRLETETGALERQQSELAARQQKLETDWQQEWLAAGIAQAQTPAEMKGWLSRHGRLKELVEQWQDEQQKRGRLCADIRQHQERCRRELAALGQPIAEEASLSECLQQIETLAAGLEKAGEAQRQQQRDLAQTESRQRQLQAELTHCEQALNDWRQRWAQAVQPLGLDAAAGIREAEEVLNGLDRLVKALDKTRSFQIRITHINQDAERFAEQVRDLCRECAPDLAELAAAEAAAGLVERLQQGQDQRKDWRTLERQLKKLDKDLAGLKHDREQAQAQLHALMAAAEVDSLEALEVAEQGARTLRELKTDLEKTEKTLSSEGLALEELEEQARDVDPDQLPGDIQEQETASAHLEVERDRQRQQVWDLENEVKAMDGGDQAAEAAEQAQQALARIKTQVDSYVRYRLSALILNREMERYREQHQGPVIQRAGELLQHMTLGGFQSLSTGYTDDDKPILLCVRANGKQVPVEGLSEGSRDQLYLALRLASLERHLEHNESPPLVVDDILINFDDRRSQATLELLGELSSKIQVLFFTHHARLLELTRQVLPGDSFKAHELDQ